MSTSILLSDNLTLFSCSLSSKPRNCSNHNFAPNFRVQEHFRKRNLRVLRLLVPNAKKKKARSSKKKSWWRKFFLEEDGNWLGLREEDLEEDEVIDEKNEGSFNEEEKGLSEGEKFEEWRKRAEAIVELREAQEGMRNEESRNWEDWLVFEEGGNGVRREWSDDQDRVEELEEGEVVGDPNDMLSERGLVEYVRDFVLGREDDDLLYEDKVFRYASWNSAKFLAILIIIPWALDFLVHDHVLMPFLDRYVKTVPLAAEMLDVRRNQKLEMVKELHTEKARLRFEIEIGKSPPLSDEEMWWELRHKALELQDEWRLENRRALANIWSDVIFGISLFLLLYFNQSKVALLKFTGYKILNNISDTGKAFLIILITDIFLGYHSESGWHTVCEVIAEHYGLEVDQAAITIFICLVPVIMDACVKLWLFKFLPIVSPKVANIFTEMKRH